MATFASAVFLHQAEADVRWLDSFGMYAESFCMWYTCDVTGVISPCLCQSGKENRRINVGVQGTRLLFLMMGQMVVCLISMARSYVNYINEHVTMQRVNGNDLGIAKRPDN